MDLRFRVHCAKRRRSDRFCHRLTLQEGKIVQADKGFHPLLLSTCVIKSLIESPNIGQPRMMVQDVYVVCLPSRFWWLTVNQQSCFWSILVGLHSAQFLNDSNTVKSIFYRKSDKTIIKLAWCSTTGQDFSRIYTVHSQYARSPIQHPWSHWDLSLTVKPFSIEWCK